MTKKPWKQTKQARYKARNPWIRLVEFARRRVNDRDPKGPNYNHYFKKGILCDLTGTELKAIWERDGGAALKRPSLDRIDAKGHYTKNNVRVIEFVVNVSMSGGRTATVEAVAAPEYT